MEQNKIYRDLKTAKEIVIKNPFEFSRQQEKDETKMPEVAQFKASQQLFNPNQINPPQHSYGGLMSILGQLARLTLTTTSRPSIIQASLIHQSAILPRSIRDVHKSGVKFMQGEVNTFEGTHGAQSYVAVNTQNVNQYLPLPETMKKEFNGIPYNELPILHIKATKNNTLIHATDSKYKAIMYTSCRLEGFKNARKKTNIAGQTTGIAAGQRLLRRGINTIRVCVKGIGPGRMTAVQGLASAGVNVVSITDRTPLCELGPRPRKIRRV
uniref:Ribosomal protein S11 n=1 Tax=Panagrolaimus sp. PS1159 TaxID=55785 RepID=A0AC35GVD4_9BILA